MFNDKRISLRFISRNTLRYSSRWAEGKFSHVRVCYHVFSSQRVDFSASDSSISLPLRVCNVTQSSLP